MKLLALTLALAGFVSTAPLGAQVVSRTSTQRCADCRYVQTTNSIGDTIDKQEDKADKAVMKTADKNQKEAWKDTKVVKGKK